MADVKPAPESPEDLAASRAETMQRATEIAIRLGALAVVAAWCLRIIAPFVGIVLWGMIIAIAVNGPFESMARGLGGRRALAAILMVLIALGAVVTPAVMLSETLISGAQHFSTQVAEGTLEIPPPPERVESWPVVGKPLFEIWHLASQNLQASVEKLGPQLKAVSSWLLHAAGSVGAGLFQLLASVIVAGVILTRSAEQSQLITRMATRLAGPKQGPDLAELARATVQSVVNGIVGVAVCQAVLAGLGYIVAGVPAAGLWALLVLVSAVVQLPVMLVMIPPVLLVFTTASTPVVIVFTLWCLFVSLIDNVLKPLLFGRGVKVPTVVIFIGAIGGMLSMGILGLFVGAVVLGLGYKLFDVWVVGQDDGAQMA